MDYTNLMNLISQYNDFNKKMLNNTNRIESLKPDFNKEIKSNLQTELAQGSGIGTVPGKTKWLDKFSDLDINKGIGSAMDLIPKYNNQNTTTQTANALFDAGSDVAMSLNPAVGLAMKAQGAVYDTVNNITGGIASVNNKENSALATIDNVLGSKLFAFTPAGFLNTITKKSVKGSDTDITKDIDIGYTPSQEIESNEYGGLSRLFNKKGIAKRKENVQKTNFENALKRDIISDYKKKAETSRNTSGIISNKNYMNKMGNFSPYQMRSLIAKHGAKLNIVKAKNGTKLPEPNKNVIPDGALHSRKNNMEQFGENITPKGIPVIAGDLSYNDKGLVELQEGGELNQTAEIEKEEIIFHKKLTIELENLYKKHKEADDKEKSNIEIEAGKLLTDEILNNTEDNVDLINKVK